MLARAYGLRGARLSPCARGHTNRSWFVSSGGAAYVLRRSFAAKAPGRLQAELHALAALRGAGVPAPEVVTSLDGAAYVLEGEAPDSTAWHLFRRLPGAPAARSTNTRRVRAALTTLALVHRALATSPWAGARGEVGATHFLQERLARVRARGLVTCVALAAQERALARITELLDEAEGALPTVEAQGLHGDYHFGNLLFLGERVTGVVDLDDTGLGAPSAELATALYAVSRDEDAVVFDRKRWDAGLDAYTLAGGAPGWVTAPGALAEGLFAAHQALVHLEAFQRGLWQRLPGIGFEGPWRSLGGW